MGGSRVPVRVADQMIAAYLAGEGLKSVSGRFGFSTTPLCDALKKRGIPTRKSSKRSLADPRRARSAERSEKAAALYRNGVRSPEIARQLGVSTSCVARLLAAGGVTVDYFREVNHDYFVVIDTEPKAYWLGMLSADGCVQDDGKVLFGLKSGDRSHVEAFRAAINSTHAISVRPTTAGYKPGATAAVFSFRSPKMATDLAKYHVIPRKSLVAEPWDGPPELMRHYWRGLVDGDGWLTFNKSGRTWNIGLIGSLAVTTAFRDFAAGVCGTRVRPRPAKTVWRVEIGGQRNAKLLADALYGGATVSLPRKAELAKAVMATKLVLGRQQFDWSRYSTASLEEMLVRLGTWQAVADELGASRNSLVVIVNRRRRTRTG